MAGSSPEIPNKSLDGFTRLSRSSRTVCIFRKCSVGATRTTQFSTNSKPIRTNKTGSLNLSRGCRMFQPRPNHLKSRAMVSRIAFRVNRVYSLSPARTLRTCSKRTVLLSFRCCQSCARRCADKICRSSTAPTASTCSKAV